MAIEAVEYITATGKVAEITGGKREVQIVVREAYTVPAYWNNPSVNCRRHAWLVPARHVPKAYLVQIKTGGGKAFQNYDEALAYALRAANRRR